ncbi:hypothetical protein [Metakosakonia massiliensis]|uniref:Deoxyribonuclease RhsC n=1 Tax=Phytobacter massiliensis TaxID=1485952 RepID=A0A6N3AJ45_9ENTR
MHNGKILTEHSWSRGLEMTRRIGDSEDIQLRNLYDSRQRLVSQRVTNRQQEGDILRRDWQYDPAGRLEKITDQRKGVYTFVHDLKGRLAEARQEAHAHHTAGLPEAMRRPGIYEQFSHDDADNLLGMDAPQEGQPHRARLYEWDCEHRLVRLTQVRRHDGGETQRESWRYRYDAFGRRWRKEDEQTGKATLFFWQDERMVTECDEDDALFDPREVDNEYVKATAFACTSYLYEPGSFRPLAQFKGRGRGGAVYWYINEHLRTPQELVDGKGNIAWSGLYRSYGQLVVQGGAVRQPLRLQGQYADEESGLHYNRYRYYNPLSGRYISQDPVSVRGGINTYAYVPDPLGWVDPLGLQYTSGCTHPSVVSGKDKAKKSTENLSENRRTIDAKDIAEERAKFLGDDAVKVGPGKWRSKDGKRQFRVKPDDYSYDGTGHGMGAPNVPGKSHVHFEFLQPTNSGNFTVIKNIHIALNI